MARYLSEIPEAGYMAVVSQRWKCIGGKGDENGYTLRYGIYNTPGVATAQAKKVAKSNRSPGVTVEWWIEKAETTWERVGT